MKVFKENTGDFKFEKPTVYMDVDDVLLDSTNAVLKVLYKRYGIQQEQVNIKDWRFRSAKRDMTAEQIEEIFESEDFWGCVELNKILVEAFENGLWDNYNWVFVTKGTEENLQKKYDYLSQQSFLKSHSNWTYYRLNLNESKSKVHMMGGIQIDDLYGNLVNTDADVKILLKNGRDTPFNTSKKETDNFENLYFAGDMNHIISILNWYSSLNEDELDEVLTTMTTSIGDEF